MSGRALVLAALGMGLILGPCFWREGAWSQGPWRVTTLAGSGVAGFAEGPAHTARFRWPVGIAVDGDGNVYVADSGNHRIRRISAGQVTTLAGSGRAGWEDGPAAVAEFNRPLDVAVDSEANVYVADSNNHRVRKIRGGEVVTLAGSATPGFADGPAATAQFRWPAGVAVDAGGNVYIADWGNDRVRKISGDAVTTLAGSGTGGFADGPAPMAQFNHPAGIAVGVHGTVYVADEGNHRIREIAATEVATLAGSGWDGWGDGRAIDAKFHRPAGLAVDSGNCVYVADKWNHRIRKIVRGQVTTFAGSGPTTWDNGGFADGQQASAKFRSPMAVAVDAEGRVYVADTWNHRVRIISPP